jgi:solute carrier family 25 ornithine transporter 2/15
MPGYFVFFGAYEGVRTVLAPAGKTKEECGPLATVAAGAVAGIALWSVIYPVDVVKSRVQASTKKNEAKLYAYILDISRREGFMSLYNGLRPTLIRTIPATGALFLSYEWAKKTMYSLWP